MAWNDMTKFMCFNDKCDHSRPYNTIHPENATWEMVEVRKLNDGYVPHCSHCGKQMSVVSDLN